MLVPVQYSRVPYWAEIRIVTLIHEWEYKTIFTETTGVDKPLLQAYRPARGRRAVRSCASVIPVSICTGEAKRVIVVVLPLPYVLNVFPSVEPTTIVNVCTSKYSIRQFGTKLTFRRNILHFRAVWHQVCIMQVYVRVYTRYLAYNYGMCTWCTPHQVPRTSRYFPG